MEQVAGGEQSLVTLEILSILRGGVAGRSFQVSAMDVL